MNNGSRKPGKRPASARRRTAGTARRSAASAPTPTAVAAGEAVEPAVGTLASLIDSIGGLTSGLTTSALKLATRTGKSAGKAISRTPEQLRMMASAGESLRDMRQVAGLTLTELAEALNLRDRSLLEAVENGREALSFELILRLASLVARNDPLPFVLKYTRTYNPRLWEVLQDLRIDQFPLQFAREREFINIYRRHDAARQLSDADFARVLAFTQHAFDLAMHFVAEQEPEQDQAVKAKRAQPRSNTRRRAR